MNPFLPQNNFPKTSIYIPLNQTSFATINRYSVEDINKNILRPNAINAIKGPTWLTP